MIGNKTWFRDVSIRNKTKHIVQQQNSSLVDCAFLKRGTGHFLTADR